MGKYEVQFDGFEEITLDADDGWQAIARAVIYWQILGHNVRRKEVVTCRLVEEYIPGWNFVEV